MIGKSLAIGIGMGIGLGGQVKPDTAVPTQTSASINAAGTTLTIVFSENVKLVDEADYALSTGETLSAAAGYANSWTMTISPAITVVATLTLAYTAGGTVDIAGNALATFAGHAITNNSEVPQPYEDDVDDLNPYAFYTLGEASGNAIDEEGTGNLTVTGATQGSAGMLVGNPATCYTFANTNLVSDGNVRVLQSPTSFTIAFLMDSSSTSAGTKNLLTEEGDVVGNIFTIKFRGSTGVLSVYFSDDDFTDVTVAADGSYGGAVHAAHHVAITYDGTNVRFYKDGVADGVQPTGALNFAGHDTTGTMILGNINNNIGYIGKLQVVSIWHSVLTAGQITALANKALGL